MNDPINTTNAHIQKILNKQDITYEDSQILVNLAIALEYFKNYSPSYNPHLFKAVKKQGIGNFLY